MALRPGKFGAFYGCVRFPLCRGTHSAHPNGKAMGIPANKETKVARIVAHEAFDSLWKSGAFTRTGAYQWLQVKMGLTRHEAHIGLLNKAQCEELVKKVETHFSLTQNKELLL